MKGRKAAGERIFLFTLVDLLLQMLFVFFAILVVTETKIVKAQESYDGKLRRLSEENDGLKAANKQFEAENEDFRKKFGAPGLPPCFCKLGKCSDTNKVPSILATFVFTDAGIVLKNKGENIQDAEKLDILIGKTFASKDFKEKFKMFKRTDCRHYVHVTDQTGETNKSGFRNQITAINTVFTPQWSTP